MIVEGLNKTFLKYCPSVPTFKRFWCLLKAQLFPGLKALKNFLTIHGRNIGPFQNQKFQGQGQLKRILLDLLTLCFHKVMQASFSSIISKKRYFKDKRNSKVERPQDFQKQLVHLFLSSCS